MNYRYFYEVITVPYKISAVGWPVKFINPSALSNSLPPLLEFHDSLIEGSCYFKPLSAQEIQELAEKFWKDVDAGDIHLLQQKTRKDKGTTKAKTTAPSTTATTKKKKSAEVIEDSDTDNESDTGSDSESDHEGQDLTSMEPT
jgi:hypothetical protein